MTPWLLVLSDVAVTSHMACERVVFTTISGDGDQDFASIAQAVRDRAYAGEPITLCLPPDWCFAASFETVGTRESGWLYQMESLLPVAAEALTFDAVRLDDEHAFGVAVERSRVVDLVRSLESHGLWISQITALPLLLARAFVEHAGTLIAHRKAFSLGDAPIADVVCCSGAGCIDAWVRGDAEDAAFLRFHSGSALPHAPCVVVGDTDGSDDHQGREPTRISPDEAISGVLLMLEQEANRPVRVIDLGREGISSNDRWRLVRRPLIACFVGLMAMLATVSTVVLLRTSQHQRVIQEQQAKQRDAFVEAFPSTPVPAAVHARLISERRKLSALTQSTAANPSTAQREDALSALLLVLRSLPATAIRVDQILVDGERVRLVGSGDSLQTIDAVCAALKAGRGLAIDSARSEPAIDEVGFAIELRTDVDVGGGQP